MDRPDVTIAVNAFRSPEMIRRCLRAVAVHAPGSGLRVEVLVADSATEAETETMMEHEFPKVRFLPFRENVGYRGLVNASIEAARGRYIFLVNADIIIGAETLRTLHDYAEAHPEVAIVGPRQLTPRGEAQRTAFRFYKPETMLYRRTPLGTRTRRGRAQLAWFEMTDEIARGEPVAAGWLMGSALFVARETARRIGAMDERYFMYMEDVDWCRRAWELGYEVVWHPGAVVVHDHQRASARGGVIQSLLFNRLTRAHLSSAVKYFWKFRGRPVPRIGQGGASVRIARKTA